MPKSLPTSFVNSLRPIILEVWGCIGYDAEEMCDGDNEIAIEMCLDADRVVHFVRGIENAKAAQQVVRNAIDMYSYPVVLRTLARTVHLV